MVHHSYVPLSTALPRSLNDNKMLHHLENITRSCMTPSIILEDFNCIANFNERIGQTVKLFEIHPLHSCIEKFDLQDMKSTCHFYTWNNK